MRPIVTQRYRFLGGKFFKSIAIDKLARRALASFRVEKQIVVRAMDGNWEVQHQRVNDRGNRSNAWWSTPLHFIDWLPSSGCYVYI